MCIRFFSLTKLMSPVLRHLSLVSCLVFGSLLVPLFALLGGQGLELSRDETGNVSERCVRVIFLDSWTGRHGVEEEGTHVTLGSVGVLLGFLLAASSGVLHGHVVLHLFLVTELVLGSLLFPLRHLLLIETLVGSGKQTSL